MDYFIAVILTAIPLPILAGIIFWFVKIQLDLGSGKRVSQNWKHFSARKKLFGTSLLAYWVSVVYVGWASLLPYLNATMLPFASLDSLVVLWMMIPGLVGLGLLLKSPTRREPLSE